MITEKFIVYCIHFKKYLTDLSSFLLMFLLQCKKVFYLKTISIIIFPHCISLFFRVIALGLPVPKYTGSPLDPPLRSRFQARDVQHLPYGQQLDILISQVITIRLCTYI